jgi:hypothetical protein
MAEIETYRIDKTEDVKAGTAALWDATNKRAITMPANPNNTQIGGFVGVFNQDRVKISDNFDGSKTYSDQLGVVVQGPAYVEVDGAVEVGDLLQFSATVAGKFTKRTYLTLNATYSHTECEGEILKQAAVPRIKVMEKATTAKRIKVVIGSI